jgi:CRP-like cAMP-binding protein
MAAELGEEFEIIEEGLSARTTNVDDPTDPRLNGAAYLPAALASHKRQIFAFHTPGDIPDVLSLQLKTLDHSLGTITPCTVGFIQHEHLRELFQQQPRLTDVFWRETLIDAAIFREWMLGIGRRDAKTRVAHLLCEMFTRLKAVGLEKNNTVPLSLTQNQVGDALGLSTVHVNRTLQALRGDSLLVWEGRALTVLDWGRLAEAGEFDKGYLHLDRKNRAA